MEIENLIDDEVADSVQKLLMRFHSERSRILTEIRNVPESCTASFTLNPEFEYLVARMLNAHFGDIEAPLLNQEKCESEQHQSEMNKRSRHVSISEGSEKSSNIEKSNNLLAFEKGLKITSSSDYANLQVVGILSGKDRLGQRIIGPSPLTAIQDKQCFILMHGNKISVISPTVEILATYEVDMCVPKYRKISQGIRFSVFNRPKQELIFFDRGHVKTLDLKDVLANNCRGKEGTVLKAKIRIEDMAGFGLAFCEKSEQFFTISNDYLVAFSTVNWRQTHKLHIDSLVISYKSNVLAINDDRLYISGDGGRCLYSVPISSRGEPITTDFQQMVDNYYHLRSIAFDNEGNILVAHKGYSRIEALRPDCREVIGLCTPRLGSKSDLPFKPTDIAVLTAPPDNNYWLSYEGSAFQCSHIIGTPDFGADCVVFFGSPIIKNS